MFINRKKIHIIYVVVDALMMIVCFLISYIIKFNHYSILLSLNFSRLSLPDFGGYFSIFSLWGLFLFFNLKHYNLLSTIRTLSIPKEIFYVIKSVFYASLFVGALIFLLKFKFFSRKVFFTSVFSLCVSLSFFRTTKRTVLRRLIKRGLYNFNTLIIGAGKVGSTLCMEIMRRQFLGIKVLGFLDDRLYTKTSSDSLPLLGGLADFEVICKKLFIDEIFITIPSERKKIAEILNKANKLHIGVRIIPENFEIPFRQINLNYIGFFPILTYQERRVLASECAIKRIFDILVSLGLVILLLPLFLIIAIAIKSDTSGPVFFIQKRMGKRGEVFNLYKFRSMVKDADKLKENLIDRNEAKGDVIFKMKDDPRITKIGRFLRRFSLDELPQLFSVLKGDMSLVGSRPFPLEESEKFDYTHMKRLSIRPGMTGLAQIRGRSNLSFYRWVKWDLWYIDNWSFGLDLKILLWTIPAIFKGKGAY